MKVQLFASTALMLISAIPGALSAEHLHLKEAVAATAADFEDDFEEKSPSAKSFSLRGAVAAASAEDAADEDEELNQWGSWKPPKVNWKQPKIPSIPTPPDRDWNKNPETGKRWGEEYRHRDWNKNPETGKRWGEEYRHRDWNKNPETGKRWGEEEGNNPRTGQPWGSVANDWCYGLNKDGCPTNFWNSIAPCMWRNNECCM
ncbi:hypothetical protein QTG54_011516 [Skeletonema marinoi]|uniref:ShKT domain-containing protein n=1 Tax=Skeletonema marinoi TaxID=267567 RepID=A0AAD9D9H2_9STRA|nr:hypothetical protein QTG54_011516 [Skeletonema marinoi]